MQSLDNNATACGEFFELKRLANENLRLRKENLNLQFALQEFKTQVARARYEAELDSKYCQRLRNYFNGGKK